MSATELWSESSALSQIDLTDHALYRDGFPHDLFTMLREEAPVWWHPPSGDPDVAEGKGFWVISRHAEIQEASRDASRFAATDGPSLRAQQTPDGGMMLTEIDGDLHLRQRKLISSGFTPKMTGRLEEKARGWAVSIIEEALERETVNFVNDVAYQLPMHMIADIVGIPHADRAHLFDRTNDMLMCMDPEHPIHESEFRSIMGEIFLYGQQLTEEKRKNPADDVWTLLTTAEVEDVDGGRSRLSQLELNAFFVLLTVAGSETTRNAISLGMEALLADTEQLALLRSDPSLGRSATEEMIRWSSPVAYFRRTVLEDTELAGVKIPKGDRVSLWYPSGNRDEAVFDDPFRFDVRRKAIEQLSFGGGGAHFCLGANLARREITILFEELLARVESIEPLDETRYCVMGIDNPITTSPKDMPVRMTAR